MQFRLNWVLPGMLCIALAGGVSASAEENEPTTSATRPSAAKPERNRDTLNIAITEAVAALELEYRAFSRHEGDLRVTSDYFIKYPAEIPPVQVVQALSRRLSRDPQADLYIRWQLLSAIQGHVEPALAGRLLELYTSAPSPPQRPGSAPAHHRELDQLVRGASQSDLDGIAQKWNEVFNRQMQAAQAAIGYRNELLRRLPISLPVLQAGFQDAQERLRLGLDTRELMNQLVAATRGWMLVDATPQQLNALATALERLVNERGPEYYDQLDWNAQARRLEWKKKRDSFNKSVLEGLIKDLNDAARGGGGGLRFK